MAEAAKTGRIMRAKESFVHSWDGVPRQFKFGTTVREGHPVMNGVEHLFEVLTPDYEHGSPVDFEIPQPRRTAPEWEQATAAPGEVRGAKARGK